MSKTTINIFIACFLGGGIGALVALELGPQFWYLGALLGALIGYFTFELSHVVQSVRRATKEVVDRYQKKPLPQWRLRYRRKHRLLALLYMLQETVYLVSLAIMFITWIVFFTAPFESEKSLLFSEYPSVWISSLVFGIALGVVFCLLRFLLFLLIGLPRSASAYQKELQNPFNRNAWIYWNAVTFPFTALYLVGRYQVPKLPALMAVGWCVMRDTVVVSFRYIHTDIRVLCAVDAAIGASVGYMSGSALFGAVAGGLLGVLNYELVSKRWLKVAAK